MSCFKMGKQLTHFSDFAQVWWPGVADSTCKKWVLYIMSTISSKSAPQFFLYFPGKQMDVRALTKTKYNTIPVRKTEGKDRRILKKGKNGS